MAESDQPIYHDLDTPEGREDAGLFAGQDAAAGRVQDLLAARRPGDDASCLNLYRPRQPRILGVPQR